MKEFTYRTETIPGMNCPNKTILFINEQAVCVLNSKMCASLESIIKYATTFDDTLIENHKIKNKIKEILQ